MAEKYTSAYTGAQIDEAVSDTRDGTKGNSALNTRVAAMESGKVNVSDIKDNLTSTDANKPLSAKQGKALKDIGDEHTGILNEISEEKLTALTAGGYVSSIYINTTYNEFRSSGSTPHYYYPVTEGDELSVAITGTAATTGDAVAAMAWSSAVPAANGACTPVTANGSFIKLNEVAGNTYRIVAPSGATYLTIGKHANFTAVTVNKITHVVALSEEMKSLPTRMNAVENAANQYIWETATADSTTQNSYVKSNGDIGSDGNFNAVAYVASARDKFRVTRSESVSSGVITWGLYSSASPSSSTLISKGVTWRDTDHLQEEITVPYGAALLVVSTYPKTTPKISVTKRVAVPVSAVVEDLQDSVDELNDAVSDINEELYIDNYETQTVDNSRVYAGYKINSSGNVVSDSYTDGHGNLAYVIWAFPVETGQQWRINCTQASGNGSSRWWTFHSGEASALPASTTLVQSGDKKQTESGTWNVTVPTGATWLIVQRVTTVDALIISKNNPISIKDVATNLPLASDIIKYGRMCVWRDGNSVNVSENRGDGTEVVYEFAPATEQQCMGLKFVGYKATSEMIARPTLSTTHLEHASSSDVFSGPVGTDLYSWLGGAHKYDSKVTIENQWWEMRHNGIPVLDGDLVWSDCAEFVAVNTILRPGDNYSTDGLMTPLCDEFIRMRIENGKLNVNVRHVYNYTPPANLNITAYYGAQSYYFYDTQSFATTEFVKTPMGEFTDWTAVGSLDSFTKSDYPAFQEFMRKASNGWCEGVWLRPDVGIGDHRLLADNGNVFVTATTGSKVYHSMIHSSLPLRVRKGLSYEWEAVYRFWYESDE